MRLFETGGEFSALVESLLREWLKEQAKARGALGEWDHDVRCQGVDHCQLRCFTGIGTSYSLCTCKLHISVA